MEPSILLQSSPVVAGELCRRVICTSRFALIIILIAIVSTGLHILFGWLSASCWGQCAFPGSNATAANHTCIELPHSGHGMVEVFFDTLVTAFFACAAAFTLTVHHVRTGNIPIVHAGGCVLATCFPRCAWCRTGHCNHIGSLAATVLIWGLGWGLLSLGVLGLLQRTSGEDRLCLTPWAAIAARTAWVDIEVVCPAVKARGAWRTTLSHARALVSRWRHRPSWSPAAAIFSGASAQRARTRRVVLSTRKAPWTTLASGRLGW